MDREWSSQPLAVDQTGWDWLSLHFNSGEKLMLYRMRQTDGNNYASGNWILPNGKAPADRLGRHHHDAERVDRDRRAQNPDHVGNRDRRRWR